MHSLASRGRYGRPRALDFRIKPLDDAQSVFIGPAMTAHSAPADIVGMFGAVNEAEQGDVLVIANDAFTGTAVVWGSRDRDDEEQRYRRIRNRRTGARQSGHIGIRPACILPISPNYRTDRPGIVGAPVSLGGVYVKPGDIMVGDADAVVVVPKKKPKPSRSVLPNSRR